MLWRELPERERLLQPFPGAPQLGASGGGASVGAENDALHPAWARYRFAEGGDLTAAGGNRFYVNHSTGAVSIERPEEDSSPRGGVLADEMGLGKTIQVRCGAA